jgi:hypothetical protein
MHGHPNTKNEYGRPSRYAKSQEKIIVKFDYKFLHVWSLVCAVSYASTISYPVNVFAVFVIHA